jgi:hypothetical protein
MEKSSKRFEEFGGRVASAWEGLRPTTRTIIERALQPAPASHGGGANYDARSEMELSRLLEALDERAREAGALRLDAEQSRELVRVADACALVLYSGGRSAEVFSQLLERALLARDYARVDRVSDTLTARLAPSEICELARDVNPAVLVELLGDPVDAEEAREALQIQADDYDSEEARWIVNTLERVEDDAAEGD